MTCSCTAEHTRLHAPLPSSAHGHNSSISTHTPAASSTVHTHSSSLNPSRSSESSTLHATAPRFHPLPLSTSFIMPFPVSGPLHATSLSDLSFLLSPAFVLLPSPSPLPLSVAGVRAKADALQRDFVNSFNGKDLGRLSRTYTKEAKVMPAGQHHHTSPYTHQPDSPAINPPSPTSSSLSLPPRPLTSPPSPSRSPPH